jgi:hypothetical protein
LPLGKQWVESEFKLLSEKVLEIMKKGGDNPDKVINFFIYFFFTKCIPPSTS